MIAACVDSCLRQTRPADQIIVVNDGSTDGTATILAGYGDAITVITAPTATGNKSGAQSLGIPHVASQIVVATDGDTILAPDFLSAIEVEFLADPAVSVVSGYVQSTKYNVITALRDIDYAIGQDFFKRAQSHIQHILVIPGCAGAFRTELFRDGTITFDHDTLTEDLDFTFKLNRAGKKIVQSYVARVYTQDPHTLSSYINQMRRWYGGGWQNIRKHFRHIFSRPSAAFVIASAYIEGVVFNLTLLALFFINTTLFVSLFSLYFVVGVAMGLYAAVRRRRLDLLFVSPLVPFMMLVNAYVLCEQLVKEIILRRTEHRWYHPTRVALAPVADVQRTSV